ncbi:deoxyribonuclease IV [Sulfobacillus sp. DSM 109850]|uniref:Deoxyribonuclease IV n=1 Tax=Sulfobacillus harzensis TaxID=2729629 RepID=A0A7Y0L206_9FIRM|nr:deoxyribonuclease IV [Sulfobacillus harzensis]
MRLGAQLSQAHGFDVVIREAGSAGLSALQLFSRNPVGGQGKSLPPAGSLKPVLREAGIERLYIHAPYFVNPAAIDEAMVGRARVALKQEMRRAKRLSGDYVVLHPGHWQDKARREESLAAFVDTVAIMLEAPGRVLVENTAGQGRELGADFLELQQIFQGIGRTRRVGLMLDTAHAMAFGYPLSSRDDVERLLERVDENVGIERLQGIHLNDSLYPVGSRRDRHARLLSGCLGREALGALLRWCDASHCPLVLETPGRDTIQRQPDIGIIREVCQEESACVSPSTVFYPTASPPR